MNLRALGARSLRALVSGMIAGLAGGAMAMAGPPPVIPPDAPMPGPSLFISPCGQPFRAGPGEPYPLAVWFRQADRNGDGRIDREEFRADAAAFFKRLDKNGDGVLDGFEVADYENTVAPEILGAYRAGGGDRAGQGRRAHGGHGGPQGVSAGGEEVMGGATPYELLSEPEPVAAADAGLTGRITLAQFLAAADRRFDLLDAKHLGYLTLDTLPRTPVQIEAERARRKAAHGQVKP